MPRDTTTYRIRAGKHERREGDQFVTYRAGDEIDVTDAELAAFPNKFEPVGGGDNGEVARLRSELAAARERITELEAQLAATSGEGDATPDLPEGEPSDDWKVPQIEAYAEKHSIDLTGLTKKAEYLEAIAAAKAE